MIFLVITGILSYFCFDLKRKLAASQIDNEQIRSRWVKAEKNIEQLNAAGNALSQELIELKRSSAEKLTALTKRFQSIVDVDAEKDRILGEIEQLHFRHQEFASKYNEDFQEKTREAKDLAEKIAAFHQEFALLEETAVMHTFGFYEPKYGFESSSRYQIELERIRRTQKDMISNKSAALCSAEWTVNGSRTEGRKQINQTLKLVLRAFNGESDAAIAKVRYNNVGVMETRILKAFEMLNKLVSVQHCEIGHTYLNTKLEELYLVHEYQEKIQEEKEEQRRIKEQMREEEIARREIEKALQEADREETRYAEALRKARAEVQKSVGEKQAKFLAQIEALEQKLSEVQANKERALSRAQMTRSGHVYIISNIGSFGEEIYKIGMTRRLEPMDRVNELGDASVPFRFDVHAIIFCEDAPALENQLHKRFHNLRINQVNFRKEFFRVSLAEIAKAVRELHGEIEFTMLAEAAEYRKTLAFQREGRTNEFVADFDYEQVGENSLLEF